jgi:hypothetical protein
MTELGKKISDIEKIDIFAAPEGELHLYTGQIGSGKTYGATADAIEEARQGRLIYLTWPVKVDDFDDRYTWFMVLKNFLFFRPLYYRIPCAQNIHFINAETGEVDGKQVFDPKRPGEYIEYLNSLKYCTIYIDEAWRVIDSYTPVRDFGIEVRNLLLVTRHKFRTIKLIAQRANSIQVTARANVNRFYKFVKISTWPWVRFARYEFQEMSGETVDETKEPISIKTYWGSKKIFNAYNSYYYAGLNDRLHELNFDAFRLTFFERLKAVFLLFSIKKIGQKITPHAQNHEENDPLS